MGFSLTKTNQLLGDQDELETPDDDRWSPMQRFPSAMPHATGSLGRSHPQPTQVTIQQEKRGFHVKGWEM